MQDLKIIEKWKSIFPPVTSQVIFLTSYIRLLGVLDLYFSGFPGKCVYLSTKPMVGLITFLLVELCETHSACEVKRCLVVYSRSSAGIKFISQNVQFVLSVLSILVLPRVIEKEVIFITDDFILILSELVTYKNIYGQNQIKKSFT